MLRQGSLLPEQAKPQRPVRTVAEWRPEPLLCKRFNVPDPYKGRPAPTPDQASRFKSDRLALPDTAEAARQLALPGPPPAPAPAAPDQARAAAPAAPVDSRGAADAFLDSLAAEAFPPPEPAPAAAPAALPPPPGLASSAPGMRHAAPCAQQLHVKVS